MSWLIGNAPANRAGTCGDVTRLELLGNPSASPFVMECQHTSGEDLDKAIQRAVAFMGLISKDNRYPAYPSVSLSLLPGSGNHKNKARPLSEPSRYFRFRHGRTACTRKACVPA